MLQPLAVNVLHARVVGASFKVYTIRACNAFKLWAVECQQRQCRQVGERFEYYWSY